MRTEFICILLLWASFCAAQAKLSGARDITSAIRNAKLETLAASGNLQQQIGLLAARQNGSWWIGYFVPALVSHRTMCCGDGEWQNHTCCGSCRLGAEDSTFSGSIGDCDEVEHRSVTILFRVEEKKIQGLRLWSENCAVDAAGARVVVITGVDPKQSVAYLGGLVGKDKDKDDDNRLGRRALDAIAEHADRSADQTLDGFAGADYPEKIREHAAFWLGVARGAHGYGTLKHLIESDPNDRFREKLIFPLSQSAEPGAQQELIQVAKQDSSSRVRGQALFWLAQKAGKKVAGVITDSIENDPDTDVKKKAVFALSQLPDHEGVAKLIEVARNNRNPAVRKQAVFWLGQSSDPRALDFIENVLTH